MQCERPKTGSLLIILEPGQSVITLRSLAKITRVTADYKLPPPPPSPPPLIRPPVIDQCFYTCIMLLPEHKPPPPSSTSYKLHVHSICYQWRFEAEYKTSECKTYFDRHHYSVFQNSFSIPILSPLGYDPRKLQEPIRTRQKLLV